MRPLPQELLLYARMDTHYLLYIYDCMKVQPLASSLALTQLSLRRQALPVWEQRQTGLLGIPETKAWVSTTLVWMSHSLSPVCAIEAEHFGILC